MIADIVEALKLLRNRVNEKQPSSIYDVKLIEQAVECIVSLRRTIAVFEADNEKMISALNRAGIKP